MGRLRNTLKKLEAGLLTPYDQAVIGTATITTATITTATITTLGATTGTIPTLNASTVRAPARLTIPTVAYTGASPAGGSIYATANYLFVAIGTTWKSAAVG